MKTLMVLTFSLVLLSCNSPDVPAAVTGGALDGTYSYTTWTCGSKDVLAALVTATGYTGNKIVIAGAVATNAINVSGGCVISATSAVTYPVSDTFVNSEQSVACGPSCSGAQCTAKTTSTKVETWSFTKSGSVISVKRTLSSSDISASKPAQAAGCAAGEVETTVMTAS